jgi:protein-tyrosine phosphatase
MKDIHNHILYNIDDGSNSYQKSIEILNDLEQRGVTDIVATPHYIIGTNYNSDNKKKLELLNKLKEKTNINLYIGNEVYLDNNILEHINNKQISTINNSRYLLVELPLNEIVECANEIIFELRNNDIVPILANPERYHYITLDDLKMFIDQ